MIESFSVENYKNFRDRVKIDFTKTKNYEFNNYLISNGMLNKVLLIGKNGTGKTNLGRALFDIVYTLTDLATDQEQIDNASFLNGFSDKRYAEFEYIFRLSGKRIIYRYRKTDPATIVYEELVSDGERVFMRDGNLNSDYTGLKTIGADRLRVSNLADGRLSMLRYIENNTIQNDNSPVSLVMGFVKGMLYFRSTQDGNRFIGYSKNVETMDNYIIKNNLVDDFEDFLKKTGAIDMKLEAAKTVLGDILVQKTGNKSLLFASVASSGTKSLQLFYYWMKHFGNVTFLFMDEFDAFYHFELSLNILRSVSEQTEFQSVLTSHNTALISNDLLRPDCYMVLDSGCIRTLPELTARELRQGHNLEKMLRNGAFDEK